MTPIDGPPEVHAVPPFVHYADRNANLPDRRRQQRRRKRKKRPEDTPTATDGLETLDDTDPEPDSEENQDDAQQPHNLDFLI